MPSTESILQLAVTIANDWTVLAIAWHVLLGTLLLALIVGWRPSNRVAGYLLVTPHLSVSALAWESGNPFNGTVFVALALAMIVLARRLSTRPVELSSPFLVAAGVLVTAFGWAYPHFLSADRWTVYLYASPFGLLPCPTLAGVTGVTLVLDLLGSKSWSLALSAAGVTYGVMGVAMLGVTLDYGLLAGAVVLGLGALARRRVSGLVGIARHA